MEVEDTYCEAFDGLFARMLITAKDYRRLSRAAVCSTALPLTVFGESEGGIEKWVKENETPDQRRGAIVQIWVNYTKNAAEKLETEIGRRVRQGILVVPTTSVFNALNSEKKIDSMERIGHCGDGYETVEKRFGREVINIPLMMGEFLVERYLGYAKGVMGGNLWFFCKTHEAALAVGERAVDAISRVDGVVTPFEICSAGSKTESKYPEIGPTTNHQYCPTLKNRIKDSKVSDEIVSIPEVVINGTSMDSVKKAMKAAIYCVKDIEGLVKISAGNYGGKLGRHKFYLKELY